MRRIIPFLFAALFLPVLVRAQISISVDPSSFVLTGNPAQTDISSHITVTNTSSESINLFWSFRMTNNPPTWLTWVCDKNLCYTPATTSCPANKPNVLPVGESFDLQVHMSPQLVDGNGDYEIKVLDDQGNVLEVITGQFVISPTTAVRENSTAKLSVFPNPTSDYFQISETPGLKYIELFNIVGNKVRSFDALPNKQYAVGDLTDGIYLVRMMTSTGKIIKTIRLSKR